ncbi:hypothetical protein HPB50_022042 [Hyalomma asiaticum]|uniref:Uncharacterized protein n=1 Tax=Hyalomma asiaticum TaxID=266040 RepID=A0ACB7S8W0_HYAAI|nr:hypothetical protein HPB50_022042 [Hyalomma asiaticum]
MAYRSIFACPAPTSRPSLRDLPTTFFVALFPDETSQRVHPDADLYLLSGFYKRASTLLAASRGVPVPADLCPALDSHTHERNSTEEFGVLRYTDASRSKAVAFYLCQIGFRQRLLCEDSGGSSEAVALVGCTGTSCCFQRGSRVWAPRVSPLGADSSAGNAAADREGAKPRTAEVEPTAASETDVVQAGIGNSSRNVVSNGETSAPATTPSNAPSVDDSERTAANSTSSKAVSASTAAAVDASTTSPQQGSTAAAMPQDAGRNLPTSTSKSEEDPTPRPTVQNSSSYTTTGAQSSVGVKTSSQGDDPSQTTQEVISARSNDSSTIQTTVASSPKPTVSTVVPSSVRTEAATTLTGVEVTSSVQTSSPQALSKQHVGLSNVTMAPKVREPQEEAEAASSPVPSQQTATAKPVTPSPSREIARNTSSFFPSRVAPAVAAMTNISEGEEVSITVIPEQEEQESKNEHDGNGATEKLAEAQTKIEHEERLASASTTTTVRSQIFSYVNYTDDDDAVEITHEKSSVENVSFSDDDNEAFLAAKDNVSSPVPKPEPSQPTDLQNLVSDHNVSSTERRPPMVPAATSQFFVRALRSTVSTVLRQEGQRRRRLGPRPTSWSPKTTTSVGLALTLPTRKTTPGAPGSPTQKPLIGRGGTRAPFGIIGSTRRTTLGTKATIRPLTKIFDRARTRPHTKATTPRPNRGPRIRITTGKPTRKGFPIGPKPTLGNETNFDLDAYTRLLHVTRRPPRPPEPTWRTTFFNLTDPTPAPNEVEAPVIRVAGIAKIVEGWEWSPLLGDHNTHEYRYLAYTMRRMLASIFRRTSEGRYLYRVDIDGFSPGSVIVDYFVLFYQRGGPVDPMELASAFNSQLGVNGSLGEEFFLDPTYTQFEVVGVVRPKPLASSSAEPPVPQWAIAVIVIATASLIFIVLFGAVTIYGRTAERRKYSSRLQDDDLENVTPSPSKDWESKLAASYENFAADSVYDTEDLHSPPPSHDPFQYDDRYKVIVQYQP